MGGGVGSLVKDRTLWILFSKTYPKYGQLVPAKRRH